MAYHWTSFDIPASELEVVPEFSEERVLQVLWNNIRAQGSRSLGNLSPQEQAGGGCVRRGLRGVSGPRGSWTTRP